MLVIMFVFELPRPFRASPQQLFFRLVADHVADCHRNQETETRPAEHHRPEDVAADIRDTGSSSGIGSSASFSKAVIGMNTAMVEDTTAPRRMNGIASMR